MAVSAQSYRKMKSRSIRIVANGVSKKGKNLGKKEAVKYIEVESEFELLRSGVFVDEISTLHIGQFNNKFVVDGIKHLGGRISCRNKKGFFPQKKPLEGRIIY